MKNLITSACIAALIATQAAAIDVPEEPTPEPPTETSSGGNDAAVAAGALLLLGVVLFAATRDQGDAPKHSPRPTVRPDCAFTHGKIGECQ